MIGFAFDDGGRAAAGYKGRTGDCVIRAIAIATGQEYKAVYKQFAALNKTRYGKATGRDGVSPKDFVPALKELGFERVPNRRGKPLLTFAEAYEEYGDCLVSTTRHLAAIVDGHLRDTGDHRMYWWEGELRERKARTIYRKVRVARQ